MPAIGENDVLVRVHAASLNAGDIFSMRGQPWAARLSVGFPQPKDYILGWDMAGHVEAVGSQVTRFKSGDGVFAACSHTFAEYVCGRKQGGAETIEPHLQSGASLLTAGITALQLLRDVGCSPPGKFG